MIVGIPKEIKNNESRISMLPFGVEDLVKSGHQVIVEASAGIGSGFSDDLYKRSGAQVVNSAKEVYQKSDLIVKVKEPQESEYSLIKPDQMMFTFFHFAADKKLLSSIVDSGLTAVAYETVQDKDGKLPLLIPMSEVAGRLAVINGAKCLESNMGGKGKLISGVSGVEAANVLVLGGGIVGKNAAKLASGLGANVYILDISANRLKYLDDIMPPNVFTLYSNNHTILDLLPKTDLLIGSVLVVGAKTPNLVTREMLSIMQKGSVIVDLAVESGGNCSLSKVGEIIEHKGVKIIGYANFPGRVAKDASALYSKNIVNFLTILINKEEKKININWDDEIINSVILSHGGNIKLECFN